LDQGTNNKRIEKAIGNYKTFPLEKQLRSDRKSSLAFAINKYGGVNYFRKLLGFEIKKHNQHFWTEKRIIEDLKKIIAKINKFPSQNDLNNLHQTKLAAQVEHKGGFLKFQKLLGFSPKHKPDGYYQNKDNILAECKKLYLQLKHFPTAAELLTLKQNTLRTAIGRSGGYKYFRNLVKEK
jgi:hypothetical protein